MLLLPPLAHPLQGRQPSKTIHGFVMDVWLTEDGLPDNTVTAITQSPDGYLWVGSASGLARFDGLKFEIVDSANLPGLGDNWITCLLAQGADRIWIHTLNAGAGFLEAGVFHPLGPRQGPPFTFVTAATDARGRLAVATGRALTDIMTYENGGMAPYSGQPLPDSFSAPGVALDKQGVLWAATHNEGVFYFERDRWNPVNPPNVGLRDRTAINPSPDGGILISHGQQLYKWREGAWVAHQNGQTSIQMGNHTHFFEDIHQNLWLVSDTVGLLQIRPDGNEFAIDAKAGLPGNWLRSTFQDREGNIWVGIDSGGLVRLKKADFESYSVEHGLPSAVATTLAEDPSGKVFVGCNPGLSAWNGVRFSADEVPGGIPTAAYSWAILFDRKGTFWLGTYGRGLYKREAGVAASVAHPLPGTHIAALMEDRDGAVWLGTDVGLHRAAGDKYDHFTRTNGLSCSQITAIAQTPDGDIWAGGDEGGLSRLRLGSSPSKLPAGGGAAESAGAPVSITHYSLEHGLPGRTVRSLLAEADGTLWIGTRRSGLGRFKNGQFFSYTLAHGLPDLAINTIVDDQLGNLWMGTQRGIFRVAKAQLNDVADGRAKLLSPILYNRGDGLVGLQSTAAHHPNSLRTRDGRLWFATLNGVSVTTPKNLEPSRPPPSVFIERVEIDGETRELNPLLPAPAGQKPRPRKALGRPNSHTVPPGVSRLALHCSAICLKAPEKLRFMWKLEGVDPDWVQAGASPLAIYRSLPPGEYLFTVRASNDEGVWNMAGASVTLNVLPFFYETKWFKAGIVLLAALALFLAVRAKVRRQFAMQLQMLEAENALGSERGRIARDLHDDLGPTVSRIILQVELARQKLPPGAESRHDLQRISLNANEIVWRLDQIVWALNPRNDEMENIVTYICKYAMDLFQDTPTSCRLDAPDQFPKVQIRSNHRHHLFLGVKEALNNVLKHAAATEVRLQFRLDPAFWSIAIIDNGQGFDPSAIPMGRNGLANLRERARLWNGSCLVASTPGSGTKVEFRGPILHSKPR